MEENAIENKVRRDVLEESQHGGEDINPVIKKENTSEGLQHTVDENTIVKEELAIDESDISTSIENDMFVMDSNATPSDINTEIKEEFIFCESTSTSNTVFMEELFLEMSCQKHFIDENSSYGISTVRNDDDIDVEDLDYEKQGIRSSESDVSTEEYLLSQQSASKKSCKKYQCDVCNKSYTLASTLTRHKLIHTGIKKYLCDICNKAFTQLGHLSQHKLIHIGVKNHQCNVCNKSFTMAYNLSRHKLIHTGSKNYQCDVCYKAFNEVGILTRHKLIHSGIKKHQCDVCNKSFAQASNLSRHKLTHTGIKY